LFQLGSKNTVTSKALEKSTRRQRKCRCTSCIIALIFRRKAKTRRKGLHYRCTLQLKSSV